MRKGNKLGMFLFIKLLKKIKLILFLFYKNNNC